MDEIVNVINLPKRIERLESFKEQAKEQGFKYQVWEGVIDLAAVFRGICNAHKNIIRYAKATKQKMVFIAEDDCVFLGAGAWDYFIKNIPEHFDLYMGMIYEGKISEIDNRIMPDPYSFSALTIYAIHERFYDAFLGMKDMDHLDKVLGSYAGKYEYFICNPMVAKQMDGWSDQKKRDCTYDHLLKGRNLYNNG